MTCRRHLRATRRPGLVAALTLPILCAVALFAGAAQAAVPTQLSASAAPQTVVYPGSAVVSGSIVDVPGADISLLARPAGAADWSPVSVTTAGADGAFRFKVKPAVTTDYSVEYAGDADHEAAAVEVTVRVRPKVTTSFPASLWLGGSVMLRGTVAPELPGATVTIDRRVDGAWQPLATVTLGADSRFSLRWTPDSFGFFRLRARVSAAADLEAGVSAAELVIVNRPNAHRVPYRYAHYIVIVRHEYRLYYYEHGALVRAFDVALGRPGYPTPLGYYHIYTKRKPGGGALGACVMFYRKKGGIAIHGTNQPHLLRRPAPRAFSHGCARMLNRQALWLYERCPLATHIHNLR